MNITQKIIITDTNIITDLYNAGILDKFVTLDNIYVSDFIIHDEINSSTCDIKIISKMKIIESTPDDFKKMYKIKKETNGLSIYDLLNYILAKKNNGILATGDNKLREYSIKHGIEVIRTLKIIKLMKENNIISYDEAIKACIKLKRNSNTRIPESDINHLISEFEKDSVQS